MHSPSELAALQVIVPTYNGGAVWRESAQALRRAVVVCRRAVAVQVVDSSSRDDSVDVARECGFGVQIIAAGQFDHGGTRNAAALASRAPLVLFLTQDAIVQEPQALDALADAFEDGRVAMAYGRQLPHFGANPIATHARLFNYPEQARLSGREQIPEIGIKVAFLSNSFAAYRMTVFRELGGFPVRTILGEDMYLAARAVLAGYQVAYVAAAQVRHSHDYTPVQEFRRYFDTGVFQHDEAWIGQAFGGAGGEGARFVKSELRYLWKTAPAWIPRAWLHDALKITGYKLGQHYRHWPLSWRRWMSMNRGYWG